jgi:hypothetical protein
VWDIKAMIKDSPILRDQVDASTSMGLQRLACVVLLGGSVRPTQFSKVVGRPLLDLPCRAGRTLLEEWREQVADLAADRDENISLRVLSDITREGRRSAGDDAARHITVTFDRDPSELRGTGGVLRDISEAYSPDDFLLVANAAQFLLAPLPQLVRQLDELRADVAVLAHRDGTPSTLMLLRCGCLKSIPKVGFIDMKEQAIPILAKSNDVRAVYVDHKMTLGLRTTQAYLAGLRLLHTPSKGTDDNWRSAFTIVEDGASVDPGARLHDSVVLRGGRVDPGAVLVRSVVCPGGTVPRNALAVDQLISSDGQSSAQESP